MRIRDTYKEDTIRHEAIKMIVKEGLHGFGVNKLARAAGVSPATIYIYFNDKEHLVGSICMDVAKELISYSLKDFDPEMPFETGLKVQWLNRLNYFIEHPVEMEFLEIMRYTIFYQEITKMLVHDFGSVLSKFTNNAIKNNELLELPFEVYWSVAFAPLYQLIKFHTQGQSYMNSKFTLTNDVVMQAFGLVLKALKP